MRPLAHAAACAVRVEDGRVAEARLCLGAVTERPTLVDAQLVGRAIDGEAARTAAEAARVQTEAARRATHAPLPERYPAL